ncbi:MAG: rhomboid family intramembrane serine protease [Candidatus Hodarchaeota archaeon]
MIVGERDTTQRLTPYVTYGLIGLNVLVFLYELLLSPDILFGSISPGSSAESFIYTYGSIPKDVLSMNRSFTLITSQFLHGSFLHIFSNMLVFWFIGDDAEDVFGHVGFVVVYLIAGAVGNIVHALLVVDFLMPIWDPGMAQDWAAVPGIGASGAIFGTLAIYALNYRKRRLRIWFGYVIFETNAWTYALFYAGLELVLSIIEGPGGGIAHGAHIGGFITGLLLAAIWNIVRGKPISPPQV